MSADDVLTCIEDFRRTHKRTPSFLSVSEDTRLNLATHELARHDYAERGILGTFTFAGVTVVGMDIQGIRLQ